MHDIPQFGRTELPICPQKSIISHLNSPADHSPRIYLYKSQHHESHYHLKLRDLIDPASKLPFSISSSSLELLDFGLSLFNPEKPPVPV